MVKVKSSSGGFVSVEITGVGEVMRRLRATGQDIENDVDKKIVQLGAFIEDEVKESIIGNRSEPKSVDTGTFGNSIEANKTGKMEITIAPNNAKYPNGQSAKKVAEILEYGTSRITARRHFRNTELRQQKFIKDEIAEAVKKVTRSF